MIAKYLQLTGFEFKSPQGKSILSRLLSNSLANAKLNQLIVKTEGQRSELLQKKLEVLDCLSKKKRKAEQRLQSLKDMKGGMIKQLEQLIDRFSKQWPNLSKARTQLQSEYEAVLEFGSQQDFKCGLSQLNSYLKLQKQYCRATADLLQPNPQSSASSQSLTTTHLHSLLLKRLYSDTLKHLTLKKLQAQIQFLQQQVIVKELLVYNATLKEEEGNEEELKAQLKELKKVIQLEVGCQGPGWRKAEERIKRQFRREKVVCDLLAQEMQDITDEISRVRPAEMLNQMKLTENTITPVQQFKPRQPKVYEPTQDFLDLQSICSSISLRQPDNRLKELEPQIESLQIQVQKLETSCRKAI